MSDRLGNALAWLEGQRHVHLTKEVTYSRGIQTLVGPVMATIGRTEFEEVDAHGVIQRTESRDFLIRASDLSDLSGTPAARDRITEGGVVYEVMSPGGAPPWRWSDPNRLTYRIHTKQVS